MWKLFWFALPAFVAAALSLALAPLVSRLAVYIGAVDLPGERKIHKTAIPRLGGLAVVVSIAAVLGGAGFLTSGRWQLPANLVPGLTFGILPILLISIVDDITPVTARRKFLAHMVGAVVAVSLGVTLDPVIHLFGAAIHIGYLAGPLSVLWLVGVTNAFNIIDGLDGLSAGLALISALSMAAVFALLGQAGMSAVALVLAGALAGFLPYNLHPARMFLGDTGATAIGFCLAAFALKGGSTLSSGFAALVPVFILGLPIADTLIAMARRSLRRLEHRTGGVFVPDSNHIHHRLLALGIDHGRAVLILYGAGLALAGAAFLSMFLNAREAALFVVALLLAGFVGLHRLGYDEFAFVKRGTVLKMYEIRAVKRGMFVVFVDVFLAVITAYLAFALKTDQWSGTAARHAVRDLSTTFAPITALVFWQSGMYRGSWRVARLHDLTRAFTAVATVTVAGATLVKLFSPAPYSVSLFCIYGIVSLVLTASLRASYVILETTKLRSCHVGTPVLIYGAGRRGGAAAVELFKNTAAALRPIGFIDDDPSKRGRLVNGLPVFGTESELAGIIRAQKVQGLLIATEKISPERVELAARVCEQTGASMYRLNVQLQRVGAAPAHETEAAPVEAVVRPALVPEPVGATQHGSSAPCPSCRSIDVHRSKARTVFERIRKQHSHERLFRCHQCGWRGWLLPLEVIVGADCPASPDLTVLDTLFSTDRRIARPELEIRDAI